MRKFFTLFLLAIASSASFGQNFQFHFDPRHALHDVAPRNYLTTTFEMFRPDKLGSTFMFVDMDFSQKKGHVGLAYTEIAREFKLGKSNFGAHVEFNGGVGRVIDNFSGFSIENAYLAGLSYGTMVNGVILSTYVAYKLNSFDQTSHDIQWTGVWTANLFKEKLTFTGFADVWSENKNRMQAGFESGKKVVFLAEPQLWYNVAKKFAVGTEIEISNNFYPFYENKLYVIPTIGAKWTL